MAKGPKFIRQREEVARSILKQAADAVERDLDQKFENGAYITLGGGVYEVDVQTHILDPIVEAVVRRYTVSSDDPWSSVIYKSEVVNPAGPDYRHYFVFTK